MVPPVCRSTSTPADMMEHPDSLLHFVCPQGPCHTSYLRSLLVVFRPFHLALQRRVMRTLSQVCFETAPCDRLLFHALRTSWIDDSEVAAMAPSDSKQGMQALSWWCGERCLTSQRKERGVLRSGVSQSPGLLVLLIAWNEEWFCAGLQGSTEWKPDPHLETCKVLAMWFAISS